MAAWRYQNFSSRVEKYVSCSFAFFNIRREIPWNELTKEFVICGQCRRWSHKTW